MASQVARTNDAMMLEWVPYAERELDPQCHGHEALMAYVANVIENVLDELDRQRSQLAEAFGTKPPSITTAKLRHILVNDVFKRKGEPLPNEPELAVLAATLTGLQYCNREIEGSIPAHLRITYDQAHHAIGHPRPYQKDWRDLALDIAAEFHKINPDPGFGSGAATARFVHAVIPLIIIGEEPSLTAVKQFLKQPYTRERRKPFARRGRRYSF
jgi:hypothetical protein